jgi:DNA-binding transcriptional ArsR family regulator
LIYNKRGSMTSEKIIKAHPRAAVILPVQQEIPIAGVGVGAALDAAALERLQASAMQGAQLLRTLANPDRLLLLCQLAAGEACVSELAASSGIGQPSLSQQLGVLRDEGLVSTRREGKFVVYRMASEPAMAIMQVLHRFYCTDAPG